MSPVCGCGQMSGVRPMFKIRSAAMATSLILLSACASFPGADEPQQTEEIVEDTFQGGLTFMELIGMLLSIF